MIKVQSGLTLLGYFLRPRRKENTQPFCFLLHKKLTSYKKCFTRPSSSTRSLSHHSYWILIANPCSSYQNLDPYFVRSQTSILPHPISQSISPNLPIPNSTSISRVHPSSSNQIPQSMATPSSSPSDQQITKQLQELRIQLGKKQSFESAVASIKSLLLSSYSSSSPQTRKLFYDVVCRVFTVLRTRYSAPGFFTAGADLLSEAVNLTVNPEEKSHLQSCFSWIRQHLNEEDTEAEAVAAASSGGRGRFLFEGHLTVDPEPAQPNWLVQQNLMTALASQAQTNNNNASAGGEENGNMETLLRGLAESLDDSMMEGWENFLPPDTVGSNRVAPPASKAVVEKLPVVKVDEGVLQKVGEDAECCICKEKLGVGDEMQELPCKHLFHPPCLKPWLDEHNSCPICRHELPTDDHKYESWKEREKELEEERRGAANAVRGGEFMYI